VSASLLIADKTEPIAKIPVSFSPKSAWSQGYKHVHTISSMKKYQTDTHDKKETKLNFEGMSFKEIYKYLKGQGCSDIINMFYVDIIKYNRSR